MKIERYFPFIGVAPWVAAIVGILISIAVIPWSEIGDAPPLGVLVVWGRIFVACNLFALVTVLAGIIATWRCIRAESPCGRVLVGTSIALLMPLLYAILILLK